MLKKAFLTCMLFTLTGLLSLGAADFGVRGGLNFSTIPSSREYGLSSTTPYAHRLQVTDNHYTGFHFGVFAKFSIGNVFIQPELLFEETGHKMVLITDDYDIEVPDIRSFTPKFSNLKIPLTAGVQIGLLSLGAGPYYAYLLDHTRGFIRIVDLEDGLSLNYNESRMGYQVMAGINIGNISIDYRFEGNFTRLGDGIDIGDDTYDFSIRPRQHVISLGITVF